MLYKETVTTTVLELIQSLQSDKNLKDFYLVGGTSLALQIGHRTSVDIDLFTRYDFETNFLLEHLEKEYGFKLRFMHHHTMKGFINEIFIDLLKHDYPFVNEPFNMENIRMLSKQDIAAMKVNAITGNGTRVKDFIDIYFLLKEFSFEELIGFYALKYGKRNEFHAVKSLTYFNDIVAEDWPIMLLSKDLTLEQVKNGIIKQRDLFLKEKLL